ncbi:hypothetical protein AKJ56_00750 [candidate division MSBL1 archaeon SCGC-AAA382N08]|uniref:Uncharacterized protein n=1 Tax=candidate division MSBL1 archaeon SCGC-AAA382N08 TaxID=1698285 RepID=A0A133VQ93_9EURY|nr:hypothetical protein AKJ56_00750 [candidate division MSBL1 archaeon SCGC-AAA382N08]
MPSNTTSSGLELLPKLSYCKGYKNHKKSKIMKDTKRRENYLKNRQGREILSLTSIKNTNVIEAFGTGS